MYRVLCIAGTAKAQESEAQMSKKEAKRLSAAIRKDIDASRFECGKVSFIDGLLRFYRIVTNTITLMEYYND